VGRGKRGRGRRVACPCCRHRTLGTRGDYVICPVCFWEDDGSDDLDGVGGPNGDLTLAQARHNYAAFGACAEEFRHAVREPHPAERRGTWTRLDH